MCELEQELENKSEMPDMDELGELRGHVEILRGELLKNHRHLIRIL